MLSHPITVLLARWEPAACTAATCTVAVQQARTFKPRVPVKASVVEVVSVSESMECVLEKPQPRYKRGRIRVHFAVIFYVNNQGLPLVVHGRTASQ